MNEFIFLVPDQLTQRLVDVADATVLGYRGHGHGGVLQQFPEPLFARLERFQRSIPLRDVSLDGQERDEAVSTLRRNEAFMDSLKIAKTRLETGVVSIEPRTGYVKAWVGGRDLATD